MPISGKIIGDVHVSVCVSPEGKTFFYLNADNNDVIPVLDFIKNNLDNY